MKPIRQLRGTLECHLVLRLCCAFYLVSEKNQNVHAVQTHRSIFYNFCEGNDKYPIFSFFVKLPLWQYAIFFIETQCQHFKYHYV